MNPRWTCCRCGQKGAAGQPRLCDECFAHFHRHDPGSPAYCGGCSDCERVHEEQHRLGDQHHQLVCDLGKVFA